MERRGSLQTKTPQTRLSHGAFVEQASPRSLLTSSLTAPGSHRYGSSRLLGRNGRASSISPALPQPRTERKGVRQLRRLRPLPGAECGSVPVVLACSHEALPKVILEFRGRVFPTGGRSRARRSRECQFRPAGNTKNLNGGREQVRCSSTRMNGNNSLLHIQQPRLCSERRRMSILEDRLAKIPIFSVTSPHRVASPHCWGPALSEPDVTVSRHTAQALRTPLSGRRGLETERCWR